MASREVRAEILLPVGLLVLLLLTYPSTDRVRGTSMVGAEVTATQRHTEAPTAPAPLLLDMARAPSFDLETRGASYWMSIGAASTVASTPPALSCGGSGGAPYRPQADRAMADYGVYGPAGTTQQHLPHALARPSLLIANKVRAYYRDTESAATLASAVTVPGCAGRGLTPVDAESGPAVDAYRAYVQEQVDAAAALLDDLADEVVAGDVVKAKSLYVASRVRWQRVHVGGNLGFLDSTVDMREVDLDAGQRWTGWHRIEKALWTDEDLAKLGPVAGRLAADVRALQELVPSAHMSVASIGNGAKQLLDEVATLQVTGDEETFSHTDLVNFQASIDGARKAYDVLRPLVSDEGLLAQLDTAFVAVQTELDKHRAGNTFVSYDKVGELQRRALARVVDGLGEPLAHLTAAAL
jgi:iron uptake system EfeUOB component EfeO/EfeM